MIRDVAYLVGVVRQERSRADVRRLQDCVRKIQVCRQAVAFKRQAEIRSPSAALALVTRRRHDAARQLREVELVVPNFVESIDTDVDAFKDALPNAGVEVVVALRFDLVVAAVDWRSI